MPQGLPLLCRKKHAKRRDKEEGDLAPGRAGDHVKGGLELQALLALLRAPKGLLLLVRPR